MAHNSYQQRGGEDESTEMEVQMLEANGHQVFRLSDSNDRIHGLERATATLGTVWNTESARRLRRLIRQHRPDVLHVQNFFPLLSPSVHHAARVERLGVVQTLRNYRLICPGGLLFREGEPCELCVGRRVQLPAVRHRCYRDSTAGTALIATMNATHDALGTWRRDVDVFVAPSQFVKSKFVQAGWDGNRIIVKPNFVYPDPAPGMGDGGYALFVGRLSSEKGLRTLLEAWKDIGERLPLRIVGDGPMAAEVETAASSQPGISWLGRRSLVEAYDLMGEATVLIVPSESYETFGRIVIEAFAKATPVVASDLGAVAELIEHGVTGLKFKARDPRDLSRQVDRLLRAPQLRLNMRMAARDEYLRKYTANTNVRQLIDVYRLAVERSRRSDGSTGGVLTA